MKLLLARIAKRGSCGIQHHLTAERGSERFRPAHRGLSLRWAIWSYIHQACRRIVLRARRTEISKRTLEGDDAKVEAATVVLGTRTLSDTVDRALDSVLAVAMRRRMVERLRRMDGLDLDKPDVMNTAWR